MACKHVNITLLFLILFYTISVNEPLTEEQLAEAWDEISDGLSTLLQGEGHIPEDVMPFDATSSVDIEQQRSVHCAKNSNKPSDAIISPEIKS